MGALEHGAAWIDMWLEVDIGTGRHTLNQLMNL
jgi:hypothetical protein